MAPGGIAAFPASPHAQHCEVLRLRLLGDVDARGDLSDRQRARAQELRDFDPSRFAEHLERGGRSTSR